MRGDVSAKNTEVSLAPLSGLCCKMKRQDCGQTVSSETSIPLIPKFILLIRVSSLAFRTFHLQSFGRNFRFLRKKVVHHVSPISVYGTILKQVLHVKTIWPIDLAPLEKCATALAGAIR